MNHEYVLFSKNTCQNSMVNVLDKDKILWYVMRAYKNENTAEDRLSNETYGLEYFIPKQKVLRTVKGKKVFFMVPVSIVWCLCMQVIRRLLISNTIIITTYSLSHGKVAENLSI